MSTDSRPEAHRPVTRVEVVDHLASAFGGGPLTKHALACEAERAGARPEVLKLLRGLPDRRFSRPQDLWTELPQVPIEN